MADAPDPVTHSGGGHRVEAGPPSLLSCADGIGGQHHGREPRTRSCSRHPALTRHALPFKSRGAGTDADAMKRVLSHARTLVPRLLAATCGAALLAGCGSDEPGGTGAAAPIERSPGAEGHARRVHRRGRCLLRAGQPEGEGGATGVFSAPVHR